MRKKVFGRKLKRTTNQRKGLFRSLMRSLILFGKIKTTEAKAKAIKPEIEKLVTKAKKGIEARREILKHLPQKDIVDKLVEHIAPVFKERQGGYTRIIKLDSRKKDNASMVLLEWVEEIIVADVVSEDKKEDKKVKKETIKNPKKEKKVSEKKPEKKKKQKTK